MRSATVYKRTHSPIVDVIIIDTLVCRFQYFIQLFLVINDIFVGTTQREGYVSFKGFAYSSSAKLLP